MRIVRERLIVLVALTGLLPAATQAQDADMQSDQHVTEPGDRPVVGGLTRAAWRPTAFRLDETLVTFTEAATQLRQRDPLKNGALIGMAVGAAAGFLGAAAAYRCVLATECYGPYVFGLAGAALGAGIGAGIDAAMHRTPGGGIRLAPLVGRGSISVVGSVSR